jgi:uncharacterized membrane protein
MPRELPLFLVLTALVGACGQKAGKVCPPDDQTACVDTTLAYDAGIGAILNDRCTPCHAAGGVEASVLLTDYKHVAGEQMTIGAELATCAMPPDGSAQLSDTERKQILDWLTCGAPQ